LLPVSAPALPSIPVAFGVVREVFVFAVEVVVFGVVRVRGA
jgi:hypothetical protein